MLQRIRGVSEKEVEMEFRDIVAASMADKAVKTSMEEFESETKQTVNGNVDFDTIFQQYN